MNTTSTIHLFIKLFLTCLTLIAWIRKESDSYCSKNGKGSHFLLWRNSFLFLLAIKLNLIRPLTFFEKQTNGEGDLLSLERLIKYVVNKNIVVKRMDNSKKNILDIKRSGNKLLWFKNVIYFMIIPKKETQFHNRNKSTVLNLKSILFEKQILLSILY